jgi:hypothetical protein
MMSDPIVDEVHRTRESILTRFNGDLRAYVEDVMRRQGQDGRTVVRGEPRPPDDWQRTASNAPEKRAG